MGVPQGSILSVALFAIMSFVGPYLSLLVNSLSHYTLLCTTCTVSEMCFHQLLLVLMCRVHQFFDCRDNMTCMTTGHHYQDRKKLTSVCAAAAKCNTDSAIIKQR